LLHATFFPKWVFHKCFWKLLDSLEASKNHIYLPHWRGSRTLHFNCPSSSASVTSLPVIVYFRLWLSKQKTRKNNRTCTFESSQFIRQSLQKITRASQNQIPKKRRRLSLSFIVRFCCHNIQFVYFVNYCSCNLDPSVHVELPSEVPVVPHKAVAEVSKIGNL
jgi:hypothetical protein